MRRSWVGCGVIALVVLFIGGVLAAGSYNRLVVLEEQVAERWAQVENVYQRRADLIPNLVETVKGARDFEQETILQVVEARSRVSQVQVEGVPGAEQLARFEQAQAGLSGALSRLLVVVERYPELRATDAFVTLQSQLEGSENRISVERHRFNEAARDFNTARRRFPTVIVASLFGFEEKPYFQAEAGAEVPPRVEF